MNMRVLAFAASFRTGSLNRKLVELGARIVRRSGALVDLVEFREFDSPMYDGDADHANGLPPGARALESRVRATDAMIIAVPEYNYSIPGPLKNVFDWVSRARPMPWRCKSVYLMSASPSAVGGIRGLWQTRIPFEGCGSLVFPDMFALANAHEAFDASGGLRDVGLGERLEREIMSFLRLAEAHAEIVRARTEETIAAGIEDQTELQPAAE